MNKANLPTKQRLHLRVIEGRVIKDNKWTLFLKSQHKDHNNCKVVLFTDNPALPNSRYNLFLQRLIKGGVDHPDQLKGLDFYGELKEGRNDFLNLVPSSVEPYIPITTGIKGSKKEGSGD